MAARGRETTWLCIAVTPPSVDQWEFDGRLVRSSPRVHRRRRCRTRRARCTRQYDPGARRASRTMPPSLGTARHRWEARSTGGEGTKNCYCGRPPRGAILVQRGPRQAASPFDPRVWRTESSGGNVPLSPLSTGESQQSGVYVGVWGGRLTSSGSAGRATPGARHRSGRPQAPRSSPDTPTRGGVPRGVAGYGVIPPGCLRL
jgi:hypothetical protein